jgi:hypothetical protein
MLPALAARRNYVSSHSASAGRAIFFLGCCRFRTKFGNHRQGFVGLTVSPTAFGGNEIVTILRRVSDAGKAVASN